MHNVSGSLTLKEEALIIDIYQHFRNEEQPLIDQLLDKCEQVNQQYAPVLTSFLDPRGQYILEVIVGSFEDMKVSYFGVNRQKERAIIAPSYFEPTEDDFEEVLIQINYPENLCLFNINMYLEL